MRRDLGPVLRLILDQTPDAHELDILIDVGLSDLFNTTYVHTALRSSIILWECYYYYIKSLLWACARTVQHEWTSGQEKSVQLVVTHKKASHYQNAISHHLTFLKSSSTSPY
jgi:hypothetical protein